ncbi:hypothetical protein DYB36_002026 [Aphanomyces astaci]|uniref:Protein kinase domain-containing protein n=1 Tax=Aphanomyces astaci TaxID=112090 RepID=A0A397AZ47_APHAT|nr:hypothetical protein DYB36_002026 [Aphanomyces astaci]
MVPLHFWVSMSNIDDELDEAMMEDENEGGLTQDDVEGDGDNIDDVDKTQSTENSDNENDLNDGGDVGDAGDETGEDNDESTKEDDDEEESEESKNLAKLKFIQNLPEGAKRQHEQFRRSHFDKFVIKRVLQYRIILHVTCVGEQQESITAVCVAWEGTTCPFTNTTNPVTKLFDPKTQTLCKAAVSVNVKQIDWLSYHSTGKGLVRSVKINQNELLTSFVYPSDSYLAANYPHCDDWFDVLPPHENSIQPGRGTQRSILSLITEDSVEFEIVYEWTGDHAQQPVCSFGGVSYVGMARMDLFYEVQDDDRRIDHHLHHYLLHPPPLPGYAPPTCQGCLDNKFGATCSESCDVCFNDGVCQSGINGTGDCVCAAGYDPATRCATCLPLHYGPSCLPCDECNYPHGNCNDGIQGNGLCSCAVGYNATENCLDCMDSFFGPTCAPCQSCHEGRCNHGLQGDGQCICREGFDAETHCTDCSTNYFGQNCTRCASCHGRGLCNDTLAGDGQCFCDAGYTSVSRCVLCDDGWDFNPTTMSCQCAPEHFGPFCRSCPICAPHGRCSAGNDGDGRCICDPGWSDSTNCVTCMGGYFGHDCSICRRCGQGRCDDSIHGSGQCICSEGYSSTSDCYNCDDGYFGPNCTACPQDCAHGTCSSGLLGSGTCSCDQGWAWSAKNPCTSCLPGYIGPDCVLCPGYIESGLMCNGHGVCIPHANRSVGICECDARFSGIGCEVYEFPLAMVCGLGLIALSTLGFCMCSMRRLARQTQVFHPQVLRRGSTFPGYLEISDVSDLEFFVSADSRDWLIPFEALTLQKEVGNGTSGQVFQSLYHSGGGNSVVAVKRLYSPVTGQEYFQSFFRREVSILSKLHHPHVVRFYGVSYYSRILYIVTDFCQTSLSHLIENPTTKGPFEPTFFMKVVVQITSGMGFLHSRNVVHRDLKPANVLLTDTDDVNICDFGLSRLIDPETTSMTAEMTAVVNGLRPVIPINCPPGLEKLMKSCWDANPVGRPSFPEVSLTLQDPAILQCPPTSDMPLTVEERPMMPNRFRLNSRDHYVEPTNYGSCNNNHD